jgi:hypothetical protein
MELICIKASVHRAIIISTSHILFGDKKRDCHLWFFMQRSSITAGSTTTTGSITTTGSR